MEFYDFCPILAKRLHCCKGLSVNEDYDYFWTVHSFDVELFEFSVPAMLHNCFCFGYSVLNVGPVFTEAQPGSNLTALCFEIAYSQLRKILKTLQYWVTKTKKNLKRAFQILILTNFHEPLEIKCNFQQASSSDSSLWLHK